MEGRKYRSVKEIKRKDYVINGNLQRRDKRRNNSSDEMKGSSSFDHPSRDEVLKLAGYIYDPSKKRYFKVPQGPGSEHFSSNIGGKLVNERIDNKEAIQHGTPKPFHMQNVSRPKQLHNRQLFHSSTSMKRKSIEDWVKNIIERHCVEMRNLPRCTVGLIKSMALSDHCDKLVTINEQPSLGCNTIQIYDITSDKKNFIKPCLHTDSMICNKGTYVEWNPHENMKNVFLVNLFGCASTIGSAVVYNLKETFESREVNSYKLSNGSAWCSRWCRNPLFSTYLGIGGNKQSVFIDCEKKTTIYNTRSSSDIFSIEFAVTSPVSYLGCRNGNITCVDFRSRRQMKAFNVGCKTVPTAATFMKLMKDENYLIVNNINGMIQMWDIRLRKAVKEFLGNYNESKLIPFQIDDLENILICAGHDNKVRLWSVRTGELLKTIVNVNSQDDVVNIPSVCVGENWAQHNGKMAFGVGVKDKLKMYY